MTLGLVSFFRLASIPNIAPGLSSKLFPGNLTDCSQRGCFDQSVPDHRTANLVARTQSLNQWVKIVLSIDKQVPDEHPSGYRAFLRGMPDDPCKILKVAIWNIRDLLIPVKRSRILPIAA